MKRYLFNEDITAESTRDLLAWLEELEKDEVAVLYIYSNGGDGGYTDIIIDALNDNPNVIIEAVNSVCSAAFVLFLFSKNKKRLNNYFQYGMIHQPDNKASVVDIKQKKEKYPGRIIYDNHENTCRIYKKRIKGVLSKSNYKYYKKGLDIFLDQKQMKKLVKKFNKENEW